VIDPHSDLPLVSIILPTFNRAETLRRAICSVRKQVYQNWELIIWDDGSTDNTKVVVKAFGDHRIHYHFAPNRGAGYARNRALAHARGEFIAFLDSDDEWLENKLSVQVSFLREHSEIDIVFSDFENIDVKHQTREKWFDHSKAALDYNKTRILSPEFLEIEQGFPESTLISNYIGTPTVILRRKCLDGNSHAFAESLRNAEDHVLWWDLGLRGYRIAYSQKVLTRRYRLDSNLSRPNVDYWKSHIKALNMCFDYAQQTNSAEASPLLRKELQNAWLKLACSLKEEKSSSIKAIKAYCSSLSFGINKSSLLCLTELLLGKKSRHILQRLNQRIRHC